MDSDNCLLGCNVTVFSQSNPDVGFTGILIKNSSIEKANLAKLKEFVLNKLATGQLDC